MGFTFGFGCVPFACHPHRRVLSAPPPRPPPRLLAVVRRATGRRACLGGASARRVTGRERWVAERAPDISLSGPDEASGGGGESGDGSMAEVAGERTEEATSTREEGSSDSGGGSSGVDVPASAEAELAAEAHQTAAAKLEHEAETTAQVPGGRTFAHTCGNGSRSDHAQAAGDQLSPTRSGSPPTESSSAASPDQPRRRRASDAADGSRPSSASKRPASSASASAGISARRSRLGRRSPKRVGEARRRHSVDAATSPTPLSPPPPPPSPHQPVPQQTPLGPSSTTPTPASPAHPVPLAPTNSSASDPMQAGSPPRTAPHPAELAPTPRTDNSTSPTPLCTCPAASETSPVALATGMQAPPRAPVHLYASPATTTSPLGPASSGSPTLSPPTARVWLGAEDSFMAEAFAAAPASGGIGINEGDNAAGPFPHRSDGTADHGFSLSAAGASRGAGTRGEANRSGSSRDQLGDRSAESAKGVEAAAPDSSAAGHSTQAGQRVPDAAVVPVRYTTSRMDTAAAASAGSPPQRVFTPERARLSPITGAGIYDRAVNTAGAAANVMAAELRDLIPPVRRVGARVVVPPLALAAALAYPAAAAAVASHSARSADIAASPPRSGALVASASARCLLATPQPLVTPTARSAEACPTRNDAKAASVMRAGGSGNFGGVPVTRDPATSRFHCYDETGCPAAGLSGSGEAMTTPRAPRAHGWASSAPAKAVPRGEDVNNDECDVKLTATRQAARLGAQAHQHSGDSTAQLLCAHPSAAMAPSHTPHDAAHRQPAPAGDPERARVATKPQAPGGATASTEATAIAGARSPSRRVRESPLARLFRQQAELLARYAKQAAPGTATSLPSAPPPQQASPTRVPAAVFTSHGPCTSAASPVVPHSGCAVAASPAAVVVPRGGHPQRADELLCSPHMPDSARSLRVAASASSLTRQPVGSAPLPAPAEFTAVGSGLLSPPDNEAARLQGGLLDAAGTSSSPAPSLARSMAAARASATASTLAQPGPVGAAKTPTPQRQSLQDARQRRRQAGSGGVHSSVRKGAAEREPRGAPTSPTKPPTVPLVEIPACESEATPATNMAASVGSDVRPTGTSAGPVSTPPAKEKDKSTTCAKKTNATTSPSPPEPAVKRHHRSCHTCHHHHNYQCHQHVCACAPCHHCYCCGECTCRTRCLYRWRIRGSPHGGSALPGPDGMPAAVAAASAVVATPQTFTPSSPVVKETPQPRSDSPSGGVAVKTIEGMKAATTAGEALLPLPVPRHTSKMGAHNRARSHECACPHCPRCARRIHTGHVLHERHLCGHCCCRHTARIPAARRTSAPATRQTNLRHAGDRQVPRDEAMGATADAEVGVTAAGTDAPELSSDGESLLSWCSLSTPSLTSTTSLSPTSMASLAQANLPPASPAGLTPSSATAPPARPSSGAAPLSACRSLHSMLSIDSADERLLVRLLRVALPPGAPSAAPPTAAAGADADAALADNDGAGACTTVLPVDSHSEVAIGSPLRDGTPNDAADGGSYRAPAPGTAEPLPAGRTLPPAMRARPGVGALLTPPITPRNACAAAPVPLPPRSPLPGLSAPLPTPLAARSPRQLGSNAPSCETASAGAGEAGMVLLGTPLDASSPLELPPNSCGPVLPPSALCHAAGMAKPPPPPSRLPSPPGERGDGGRATGSGSAGGDAGSSSEGPGERPPSAVAGTASSSARMLTAALGSAPTAPAADEPPPPPPPSPPPPAPPLRPAPPPIADVPGPPNTAVPATAVQNPPTSGPLTTSLVPPTLQLPASLPTLTPPPPLLLAASTALSASTTAPLVPSGFPMVPGAAAAAATAPPSSTQPAQSPPAPDSSTNEERRRHATMAARLARRHQLLAMRARLQQETTAVVVTNGAGLDAPTPAASPSAILPATPAAATAASTAAGIAWSDTRIADAAPAPALVRQPPSAMPAVTFVAGGNGPVAPPAPSVAPSHGSSSLPGELVSALRRRWRHRRRLASAHAAPRSGDGFGRPDGGGEGGRAKRARSAVSGGAAHYTPAPPGNEAGLLAQPPTPPPPPPLFATATTTCAATLSIRTAVPAGGAPAPIACLRTASTVDTTADAPAQAAALATELLPAPAITPLTPSLLAAILPSSTSVAAEPAYAGSAAATLAGAPASAVVSLSASTPASPLRALLFPLGPAAPPPAIVLTAAPPLQPPPPPHLCAGPWITPADSAQEREGAGKQAAGAALLTGEAHAGSGAAAAGKASMRDVAVSADSSDAEDVGERVLTPERHHRGRRTGGDDRQSARNGIAAADAEPSAAVDFERNRHRNDRRAGRRQDRPDHHRRHHHHSHHHRETHTPRHRHSHERASRAASTSSRSGRARDEPRAAPEQSRPGSPDSHAVDFCVHLGAAHPSAPSGRPSPAPPPVAGDQLGPSTSIPAAPAPPNGGARPPVAHDPLPPAPGTHFPASSPAAALPPAPPRPPPPERARSDGGAAAEAKASGANAAVDPYGNARMVRDSPAAKATRASPSPAAEWPVASVRSLPPPARAARVAAPRAGPSNEETAQVATTATGAAATGVATQTGESGVGAARLLAEQALLLAPPPLNLLTPPGAELAIYFPAMPLPGNSPAGTHTAGPPKAPPCAAAPQTPSSPMTHSAQATTAPASTMAEGAPSNAALSAARGPVAELSPATALAPGPAASTERPERTPPGSAAYCDLPVAAETGRDGGEAASPPLRSTPTEEHPKRSGTGGVCSCSPRSRQHSPARHHRHRSGHSRKCSRSHSSADSGHSGRRRSRSHGSRSSEHAEGGASSGREGVGGSGDAGEQARAGAAAGYLSAALAAVAVGAAPAVSPLSEASPTPVASSVRSAATVPSTTDRKPRTTQHRHSLRFHQVCERRRGMQGRRKGEGGRCSNPTRIPRQCSLVR